MLEQISRSFINFSEVHGYGAFASEDLKAGEVIEQFLIFPLAWRSYDLDPRVNALKRVALAIPSNRQDWDQKYGITFAMPNGNIGFYNHDAVPNTKILQSKEVEDHDGGNTQRISFNSIVALRDIEKGLELFLDYATCYCADWPDYFPQLPEEEKKDPAED